MRKKIDDIFQRYLVYEIYEEENYEMNGAAMCVYGVSHAVPVGRRSLKRPNSGKNRVNPVIIGGINS